VVGVLVFSAIYYAAGNMLMVGMQIAFSVAMMALLFGDAGKVRMAVAMVTILGLFGLETLGLRMMSSGVAPVPAMLESAYDLEPIAGPQIESERHPYTFDVPGAGWSQRTRASAQADNPLSDIWLVNPEYDAHILIVAESADPGYEVMLDAYADQVEANAAAATEQFAVMDRGHIAAIHTLGKQIDASGVHEGLKMRFRYGLFAKERHGVQMICFGQEKSFEAIEAACDSTLESFQFVDDRVLAAR